MKGIIIKIIAGIVTFSAGIGAGVQAFRMYDRAYAPREAAAEVSGETGELAENMGKSMMEEELRLQVRDGNLEWFDGVRWKYAGSVEELAAADPIAHPSQEWLTLAAQLADACAEEHAADLETFSRESGGGLLVGAVTVTRPQNGTSGITNPDSPPTAQPGAPANPVNSNSSSKSSSNNNNRNDSDSDDSDYSDDNNGGNEDNSTAPAPDPAPEPEPEPDPGDTGDGENIEWSGDYE